MSDLISREKLLDRLNDFNKWCKDKRLKGSLFAADVVGDMPSADIMECARAMKSFCWKTDCANCPIFLQCGEAGVRPCDWDLPEGEAKPNESLIKDCCEAQGHLWADNNIFEDVEENQ